MVRKKSKLTTRKNKQSTYHIARATATREERLKTSLHKLQSNSDEADVGFLGFDVSPWKPAIRVLSLFDGMGSALHILDKLAISVEVYYSCEVDDVALRLQEYIFGDRLTALGSVENLTKEKLESLGKINLLIGGSPCSDLSLVNPKRRGLHGKGSTGRLFFNYVSVLSHLKQRAALEKYDFFWVFENTAHMEKKTLTEINRYSGVMRVLGCTPLTLCLSEFQPMRRKRLLWGNVLRPKDNHTDATCFKKLQDHLSYGRIANVVTVPTLTTCSASQRSTRGNLPVLANGVPCSLYISELESLMGYPVHFTDGPNLTLSDRRKMLGKSFAVPVFKYLLYNLRDYFRQASQVYKEVGPSQS